MPPFRTQQPGKPDIESGDSFGSGLLGCRAKRDGGRCRRQQGAAGSLVASVSFAAERSDAAQLQGRFVEKRVRVYVPDYSRVVPNAGRLPIVCRGKVVGGTGNACAGRAGGHPDGMKSSAVVCIDWVNIHGGVPLSRSSRAHT